MIIFNHIPRTGGTFLVHQLTQTSLANGPHIRLGRPEKWVPEIRCDRQFRPTLLIYHTSGHDFSQHYQRQPGDFVFTFLRNRVDMVYSNYAYMRARVERGDHFPGWKESDYEYFLRPPGEYVDAILDSSRPEVEFPVSLEQYDLIGITEEMDRSLALLNRVLGTHLKNDCIMNSVPCEKTYRRADLEKKFAFQLNLYRRAREGLLSGEKLRTSRAQPRQSTPGIARPKVLHAPIDRDRHTTTF